jgi:molybdate transport system ATP-binding protein
MTSPLAPSAVPALQVRVSRQIHPGLRIEVALDLGAQCGVIFGPSGAGKTSLLRLIAGLDRPDSGLVLLGGTVLTDTEAGFHLPLRRRQVGMVFQDDLLFPHLDVERNIAFGLRGWTAEASLERVEEVAALCGVESQLKREVGNLSGGERQRVGLARALAPRPRLLLCDEPVSALDHDTRFLLLDRLRAVQAAEQIPMLHVTHSPAEAILLATRLFRMVDGRIADEGPPLEVLSATASGQGALDGLSNVFSATVRDHAPEEGATRLELDNGPEILVARMDVPPGSRRIVCIRSDDIMLARSAPGGLSARNILHGVVEQILRHGPEAEITVRTGGLSWIVSVVEPAVGSLDLKPNCEISLIIKARSCHLLPGDASQARSPTVPGGGGNRA